MHNVKKDMNIVTNNIYTLMKKVHYLDFRFFD